MARKCRKNVYTTITYMLTMLHTIAGKPLTVSCLLLKCVYQYMWKGRRWILTCCYCTVLSWRRNNCLLLSAKYCLTSIEWFIMKHCHSVLSFLLSTYMCGSWNRGLIWTGSNIHRFVVALAHWHKKVSLIESVYALNVITHNIL